MKKQRNFVIFGYFTASLLLFFWGTSILTCGLTQNYCFSANQTIINNALATASDTLPNRWTNASESKFQVNFGGKSVSAIQYTPPIRDH